MVGSWRQGEEPGPGQEVHVGGSRDPAHDRVRLTPHERADFARLERSLQGEAGTELPGAARARSAAARRAGARLWAGIVRLAPWLTLTGLLAMPFAISASTWIGASGALFLTVAVTIWVVSALQRRRVPRAARGSPSASDR
jgi:hypothetical protein